MEAIAKAKNLRGSARKARLVLDLIRGKAVNDAKSILVFSNKRVAFKVEKILDSAIANLKEKEGKAKLENYVVSKAYADDGPIMRRFMPRAQGRATVIRKRTCHITVALSPNNEVTHAPVEAITSKTKIKESTGKKSSIKADGKE